MPAQDKLDSSTSTEGFTGVVWQSRPTEKLAADLAGGSGPGPLAEAGLAWAELAEEFAQAGIEYSRILVDLGVHWESATYNDAFERLTRLAPWFAETAAKLVETAGRAEAQAAANTVALATMPSLPEIAITEELAELLAQAGVMLGAPIAAAGAKNDRVKHELAQHAARVMESYERATVPVATPWKIGQPPVLVSGDALAAERTESAAARAKTSKPTVASGATGALGPIGGFGGLGAVAREKTRYVATSLASTEVAPAVAPAPSPEVTRSGSMMPPMAPMMGAAGQSDSSARATRSVATPTEAESGGVRLPEGWLSDDDGTPTSWAQVSEQIEAVEARPMLKGEGVLNLGPSAPAVIGESDEIGDR